MQTAVHIKIRTILVIILSALVTSIIVTVAFPHRTHALVLETVQSVTNQLQQAAPVVAPLAQSISPSQAVVPSQPSVARMPVSSSTPATSAPTGSVTPATSVSTSNSATEIKRSETPLITTKLQTIQFSQSHKSSQPVSSYQASTAHASESGLYMWVQPTDEGWKLFGILWYWWGLLFTYIATVLVIWKGTANWYPIQLWLSWQYRTYAH